MEKATQEKPSIEQIQSEVHTLNIANECGVLLGILADKLEVTPSKTFWQDIVQNYSELQAASKQAQEKFTKAVEEGLVPTAPKS